MTKIKVGFVIKKVRLFIAIFSFFSLSNLNAQLITKSGYIGLKSSYGIIDTSTYFNVGLTGEYFLKSRIGLIYNLEYQKRNNGFKHVHGSIGSLGGPPLILFGLLSGISDSSIDGNSSGSVFGLGYLGVLLGVLITVLPDGVSYHIPVNYNGDISPYANVLGFDYIWNKNMAYSEWKYACSFGVKGTYWHHSNWMIQGFIETRKAASTGWGIGAGAGISYSLGKRKVENE